MSTPFWPGLAGSWVTWTAPLLLSCFNWFCSPIRITLASTNLALRSIGLRGSAGGAGAGMAPGEVEAGCGVGAVAEVLAAGRAGVAVVPLAGAAAGAVRVA